uniref:Ribosomal protein L6 n=1 Tax=Trachydiscus minutus TaxID=1032745 RepID=A0A140F2N7_9STRA|nr:ribosomal protein L6 [Trachydiscus minutus]AML60671.1 ribosomal protein L6 [Trachydiscus minutus]
MVSTFQQFLRHSTNLELKYLPNKNVLVLKGPLGVLCYLVRSKLRYSGSRKKFWLTPQGLIKKKVFSSNQVLLTQSCLGVTLGYRRQLNLVGIGYQASLEKKGSSNFLVLKLGYSHLVKLLIPDTLKVTCPKPRFVLITGTSPQKVNNFAALLRVLKLPNPYKEKGIYYKGETLKLKQGKKT